VSFINDFMLSNIQFVAVKFKVSGAVYDLQILHVEFKFIFSNCV